jgi:hypothetical protein
MNPTYIYAKTDTGEDAVVQRTRLVQRNLRTVLILVDGKSTVEDLVERVGSAELVNQALDQLERDGFIKRVGTGNRQASEPKPAATTPNAPIVPTLHETPPKAVTIDADSRTSSRKASPAIEPVSDFPSLAPPEKPAKPAPPASPFGSPTPAQPQVNPFAPPPQGAAPVFTPAATSPAAGSGQNPFQTPSGGAFGGGAPFGAPSPSQAQPVRPAMPQQATAQERGSMDDTNARILKRRTPLLTPKRIFGGLGALLVILALTIVFFPYGNYKPRIEAALTAAVGQPVTIGSVHATFSPSPTLVLSQVGIGSGTPITIAEVRAVPSAFSLVSSQKSFSRIILSDSRVPMEQIGLLATGIGAATRSDSFLIGGIDFERITVGLRDLSLAAYSGRADMAADGGLKRMNLVSPDQTLKLSVEGAGKDGVAKVLIEGQGWKPGENSPYTFDSLSISGDLSGTRLQVQKVEGRIFGGVIQGQFALDWSTGMVLAGDISVDYMSAPLLAQALGSGKITVEGQANARVRFSASGDSWNALSGKVPLEGDVIMKSGAINGMDFVEAVRRGSRLAMRGGTTRFEQATGRFRWDGQALQLSGIDISSGFVRATGSVGVLKGEQLSGVLNMVLRGSAATVATPVTVTGTLNDPQLFGGRR